MQHNGIITPANETSGDNDIIGTATAKRSTLNFLDAETKEPIAKCETTGPAITDMKFTVYRQYTGPTFFNAKIGVFEP